MPKNQFVDFKAVKADVNMEQVLQHYGLLDRFKRSGDSLSGPCPIHKGTNPTQFRVSVSKNVWNCFSECKNGGNVLDFIARMEDISIQLRLQDHLTPNARPHTSRLDGTSRRGFFLIQSVERLWLGSSSQFIETPRVPQRPSN